LLCEENLKRIVAQEDYEFGDVLGEGAFGAVSGVACEKKSAVRLP
jgi:hypothetical protein